MLFHHEMDYKVLDLEKERPLISSRPNQRMIKSYETDPNHQKSFQMRSRYFW